MTRQADKKTVGMRHLYSLKRWKIGYLTDPARFFRSLHLIVPANAILYFEGNQKAPAFDSLLKRHGSHESPHNFCGKLSPALSRHASYTTLLVSEILKFYWEFPKATTFDHLHCYCKNRMIFWFHDALIGGDMHIDTTVRVGQIRAFCSAQGPQYSKEDSIL